MEYSAHSQKQSDAIFSNVNITAIVSGIQWGKTLSGALWLKRKIYQHTNDNDNFLIVAPTYKILNQSTLPAFLHIMRGCGEYSKTDAIFKVHGGGTVYMRTSTDPDSIVGMTRVRGIWGDEAGLFSLYFWDNLEGRAAFMNAPIILTTSPYSLNWLYTRLIRPYKHGDRDDVKLIQARSDENPYFPKEVYEQRRKTMDIRRFNAMYGGNFERMQGLVYDCFDEDENVFETANLSDARYFGAIDWGFTDPFVFKLRAVTPSGMHYSISEFYKTGMTLTDIAEMLRSKMRVNKIETIYCDPSQPGYIEELNRKGIPCVPANNDIRRGIDLHYELVKTRKYKILKSDCKYTLDEYSLYHWPEPKDLRPDEHAKEEKPVDQNNHCMDVERYLSIMTSHVGIKRSPKIVDLNDRRREMPIDFVNRIRKNKRDSFQTENWS